MSAIEKLNAAIKRTGCVISAGIEPAPDYLPPSGFEPTPSGYLDFFRVFIEATRDLVAAYKFNLAFFESMGVDGARLLADTRAMVPDDVLLIADAKRGDIGSTAKHYAKALYEVLGADAATVNPLMGRDSAEPFLDYGDRLTYFLGLTSNPGAADFLQRDRLFERIAKAVQEWSGGSNAGLVVGATRGATDIGAVRAAAPTLPFLVPGVGAQGGDAAAVFSAGAAVSSARLEGGGVLIHSTRGLLVGPNDGSSATGANAGEIIRQKTMKFAAHLRDAMREAVGESRLGEEVRG